MKEEELPKKKRGRKKKIVEPAQIMSGFIPSKYQQDIFDFIQHGNGNSVINALAGSGKCLGVDTEILMYDGSIKKVQDIIVGDKLMGDDSTPRTVLSVTKGYGQLRKIQPKKGDAWVCNDVHILTLSKYITGNKHNKGKFITVDIPINELENNNIIGNTHHTDGDFRMYKLLKTGVKFRENAIDIDPWLYGMWLGDGTTNQSSITNVNENVINEIEKTIPYENYIDIKKYRDKCPKINILTNNKHKYNSFRRFVRSSSINNEKFILKNYLINTEEVRLKLLAGLIDSDGYYKKKNYYISTKFDMLAKDILFLCRSLGFSAYDKIKNKKCYNNGVIKPYHNITISGDIEKIPVVTDYKKADKRLINKNVCHVGFRIDKIGEGDYYGFTLDGNGRFLLSDFTITHNTSTIVNAVKLIPSTCNALFIAFNKEIVKELEKKLAGVKNVQVKTLHSLGLLMIRRNLGTNIEIDEYKYRTFIKKNIKQLSSADFDKMTTKLIQQYTDNVIQLCDLGRYNLAQCEKDLLQVSARHDIPIIDDECNAVLNVMKWGRENTTSIDFTDMVWLPYELTLNPIGLQYDYIFIDECQDLNAAQRELFLRCFRRGTRFIAVGDKKQAIYSFAGADAESFAKLQNLPNTTTLPLPISYRCPKKVVNLANQFVDTMECREGAPDGEIVHNVSIKDIHDGDMVLCRTKMPLIKLYMRYLRMGVKSYVRGQDIGLNLLRMVDKTEQIVLNVSLQKDGVFARLYDDLFEERNRLMIKRGMDLEDATLSNQIMNKYDSIKALEILAEGLTSARNLHDRIENVFAESADGVCLSTIHKAKGLEANNVYILCKTLMPSRLATQDWEKEQEQNLMYVAYTRAKYKLGFVSETEISPSAGMIDPSAALTELNYIENKICKLLNKTPQVIMDATEVAQYNLKSATIIEEKETNHAEISSSNNEDSDSETMKKLLELVKKKGGIEKFEKFLEQ